MSMRGMALMTLMLAAAAQGGGRYRSRAERQVDIDERHKELGKALYGNTDTQEREFIIKGESIMARDRKTAQKIYARRHKKVGSKPISHINGQPIYHTD